MANILLAEDDKILCDTTQAWLERERHKVDLAADGALAWQMLTSFDYDLLILDWDMPELSGIDLLRRLRGEANVLPVLMLTGKQALDDKELALDEGADDYLTKPFHPRELSARLRALLRRPAQIVEQSLAVRDVVLAPAQRRVTRNGKDVALQPLEFDLLEFFLRHPNQVFSIDALIQRVWGTDSEVSLEAAYSCIKRMRKKLDTPGQPSIIKTLYATGYCLET